MELISVKNIVWTTNNNANRLTQLCPMFFSVFLIEFATQGTQASSSLEAAENQEMEQPGAKVTSRGVGATSLGGNLNVVVVI